MEEANDILAVCLCEITAASDVADLVTVIHRLASRYGIKTAAYLGAGIYEIPAREPCLAVTYSDDWVEHYKKHDYVNIDPVIRLGMRRLLPIDWSDFGKPEGALKAFFGEASEFGLGRCGLTVPVHGIGGDRALFSITSELSDRDWKRKKLEYMRDFQVLAVHLHERVLTIAGQHGSRARLSPRELECLSWTSEGKTAWECATILGLSEHTVRCYLESVRYKLKASSNTHAVSIAHRAGMFSSIL